jgi:hypothetical protein
VAIGAEAEIEVESYLLTYSILKSDKAERGNSTPINRLNSLHLVLAVYLILISRN